jgi:DNA-binding SARP family transcriptional activator
VEFLLLGPVTVLDDGRPVPLPPGKPLILLRALLLERNRVVSVQTLIDEILGDDPPDTATKALHGYVSQLRKALGADRLLTRPPGYALRVEEGELDLDRFERLAREGREQLAAGDAAGASRNLGDALALWRGPAPALEARRLAALEVRVDADLALGHAAELVAELEALIAEHRLRERMRGQLMLALYRSGRQADALEEYRRTRETLVDELGIEPGEELQELQRAILRHDRALDGRRSPVPAPPGEAERGQLVRWTLVAIVAIALVAAAVIALAVFRGGGSSAELRTFVTRVENLLVQSRDGRRDVIATIHRVNQCRIGPRVALNRLDRVQRNRQSLLQQVAALSVPGHAGAQSAADLLQRAEQRSIAADWHYRDWLKKQTTCGSHQRDADLHLAYVTDRDANRVKRQFVAVFNPLAQEFDLRIWTEYEF